MCSLCERGKGWRTGIILREPGFNNMNKGADILLLQDKKTNERQLETSSELRALWSQLREFNEGQLETSRAPRLLLSQYNCANEGQLEISNEDRLLP